MRNHVQVPTPCGSCNRRSLLQLSFCFHLLVTSVARSSHAHLPYTSRASVVTHCQVIASGKVLSGFSIVRNLALGADVCNSARAMLFALGCIQVRLVRRN